VSFEPGPLARRLALFGLDQTLRLTSATIYGLQVAEDWLEAQYRARGGHEGLDPSRWPVRGA
jgi:hypothetical protein